MASRRKTQESGKCVYDWQDKNAGKLACRTHPQGHHTVTRMRGYDQDTLIEMYRQGILTGEALSDAQEIVRSSPWVPEP